MGKMKALMQELDYLIERLDEIKAEINRYKKNLEARDNYDSSYIELEEEEEQWLNNFYKITPIEELRGVTEEKVFSCEEGVTHAEKD